jgi:hypothetical protein
LGAELDFSSQDAVKGYRSAQVRIFDMVWLHLLSYVLGGVALANAVPHLVNGASGRPFQTPFANPPGEGLSSSTVNVLWGFFNLVVGWLLVAEVGAFDARDPAHVGALALGALAISLFLARRFGRLHGGNAPG